VPTRAGVLFDVVVVGDSVCDAEPAERAGVPFVGLTCGGAIGHLVG